MDECELLEKCLRWQLKRPSWKVKYKTLVVIKVGGDADYYPGKYAGSIALLCPDILEKKHP